MQRMSPGPIPAGHPAEKPCPGPIPAGIKYSAPNPIYTIRSSTCRPRASPCRHDKLKPMFRVFPSEYHWWIETDPCRSRQAWLTGRPCPDRFHRASFQVITITIILNCYIATDCKPPSIFKWYIQHKAPIIYLGVKFPQEWTPNEQSNEWSPQ